MHACLGAVFVRSREHEFSFRVYVHARVFTLVRSLASLDRACLCAFENAFDRARAYMCLLYLLHAYVL